MLHGLADIDMRVTEHYLDTIQSIQLDFVMIIVCLLSLLSFIVNNAHCVFNILSLLLSFLSFIVNNASHFLSVHDHKLQFVIIQR